MEELKQYIGTKIIGAKPMDMQTAVKVLDRPIEAKETEGYFVVYEDGYESWSPMSAFDNAYRRCEGMNFGLATEAAKKGAHIARKGWNAADMFAFIRFNEIRGNRTIITPGGKYYPLRDAWMLKTAQGDLATWAPSGSDSLAEDWFIVTDK